jgi:3-methyladenine DNA glycosylase AlkD
VTHPDLVALLVERAQEQLRAAADPMAAGAMRAYMRDQFAFLGVQAPARTAALRQAWAGLPRPSEPELLAAVRQLWALPEREYQYAACDLLKRYTAVLGADTLETTLQTLIVTRSWWDSVDALRGAAVGPLVRRHPELVAVMRRWVEADDRWLVRSAIIHQLGYGAATDAVLLFELCARRAGDTEFFVAKAIGWALRTYARRAPGAVLDFVDEHPELTPLARREATKHLDRQTSG